MSPPSMTSAERVTTTLGHQEPDRVPFLLPTILQGARELGLSIEDYFSRADDVVEGQLRLRARLGHDGLFAFMYAAQEVEAWGGETIFIDDGPPNAGEPPLDLARIQSLEPPDIDRCQASQRVLRITQRLRARVGDEAPILGVALSPLSMPVLQFGFLPYLDLLLERPPALERLMRVNEDFCVAWANAQLAAGASAISYTDPVSSCTIIPPALYRETGYVIARRTLARFDGPAATGFASGRCLPILDDVARTGARATSDPLPRVLGDKNQLVQLLQNLVGNAIKYRGEAAPEVHVGARQLDGRWQVWVRDNGIGLEMTAAERIFKVFERLHAQDEIEGTGIGLATCKRIVQRHGGQIWVEATPGQGATFYFTLQPVD